MSYFISSSEQNKLNNKVKNLEIEKNKINDNLVKYYNDLKYLKKHIVFSLLKRYRLKLENLISKEEDKRCYDEEKTKNKRSAKYECTADHRVHPDEREKNPCKSLCMGENSGAVSWLSLFFWWGGLQAGIWGVEGHSSRIEGPSCGD